MTIVDTLNHAFRLFDVSIIQTHRQHLLQLRQRRHSQTKCRLQIAKIGRRICCLRTERQIAADTQSGVQSNSMPCFDWLQSLFKGLAIGHQYMHTCWLKENPPCTTFTLNNLNSSVSLGSLNMQMSCCSVIYITSYRNNFVYSQCWRQRGLRQNAVLLQAEAH